ncbi:tetratricopeptide repeat protein [Fodinibius salsisoli]|uniref:Tetratricopeptide repeat-containing protein n=1 Tax=Fodinibius salsisoli TaxID=2820877 RepID=A0ABT3PSB2_9BACT|nr:tetratricopeptide repeat protein [Fodinibius salsisoli]MCW9708720.1 hypothetical protein [Fodinibius salsisoli]
MKSSDKEQQSDRSKTLQEIEKQIKSIDFDRDTGQFVTLLGRYRQISREINLAQEGQKPPLKQAVERHEGKDIQTPGQLVARFTEIYQQLETRYDLSYWKSAIKNARENTTSQPGAYCMPIIEFLSGHSLLKSEVFALLKRSFPFVALFRSPEWEDLKANNEKNYPFLESIVDRGNFELDLLIDAIPIYQYEPQKLDFILPTILHATGLQRNGRNKEAFQAIAQIEPENMPLVGWQRLLQILYQSAVLQENEKAKELFVTTMGDAVQRFPNDEELLYLQRAFLFETRPAVENKADLISMIKEHPLQLKLLFLLGKCCLDLKEFNAGHVIFKKLSEINPTNLEYAAYVTLSLNGILSRSVKGHAKEEGPKAYYKRMLQQLELDIFDLVEVPKEHIDDPDIKALKIYAHSASRAQYNGSHEPGDLPETLHNALSLATNKEVRVFLIDKLMVHYPNLDDLLEAKEMVLRFYKEFPDAHPTVFAMAGIYMAENNYEQALSFYEKARDLNPQNIYACQGVARAALHLQQYDKSIEASRIFQHERRYDRAGFYCMGKSYFDMGEYDKAYTNFKWMVQLIRPQPSAHDQYVFMASLGKHVAQLDKKAQKSLFWKREIEEALQLFDSLKKEGLGDSKQGRWAVFHAAKLCEHIAKFEKGLEYLNLVIDMWRSAGIYNLGDAATLKTRFLMMLLRMDEAKDFLQNYISYLEREQIDQEYLKTCQSLMAELEQQYVEEDDEYMKELRALVLNAATEPHRWRPEFVELMRKAMMAQAHPQMVFIGERYFQQYGTQPDEDDIFMSFWTAKAYKEFERWENAKPHFQNCLDLGAYYPKKYYNLITMAGNYLRNNA